MNSAASVLEQDAAARAQALDVSRSWLVQAPAGSGKTGLLIQRYLALLAHVDAPERVVAMTFTRKAAAEMRERVLDALMRAAAPQPEAASAHERVTLELARNALEQDRRHGWKLIEHPARLRIETIDAYTTALARAAPIATGLGALPQFLDDATPLYRAAGRAALAAAAPNDAAWRTFLQWIDNDAQAAVNLLAEMLAARDRWPKALLGLPPERLRAELERVLAAEICASLRALRALFPDLLARELMDHARVALDHLDAEDPDRAAGLRTLVECAGLPEDTVEALTAWQALADWTMTQTTRAFTRQVTKAHGFPPVGNGIGARERGARKAAFERCLEGARAIPGLEPALAGVRDLPPARFGDDAWAFVEATLAILPSVAAQLLVVMRDQHKADFAEAMLRALAALGTPDEPEDLLLAIDGRIDHLLVDEFQDTSAAQLELIARLTSGWQPGDSRTLFAVGDPMQSIYRFREAEVRIFIEAQARGRIAHVPVGTLSLGRNFRSRASIVHWVNDVFAQVLPAVSDAARGEVAFRAAHPQDDRREPQPALTLCADRTQEAQAVIDAIRAAQAQGAQSIAVLVRARAHVQAILPGLREAGVAYQAVELEPLQERLPSRDLVSLARALAQPGDRVAWLAVLRAPWCALSLADLLVLAGPKDDRPLLRALDDPATLARLSPDGAQRARRFRAAIEPALAARGRAAFSLRVRAAWLALGGPLCVDTALDRDGADRVFALLAQHERGGDLADYDAFLAAARRLHAVTPAAAQGGVQIMTLHKAKGLEFDAVILPGLDQQIRGGQTRPLRWKFREVEGRPTLVLAPLKGRMGADAQPDPVYDWLSRLDAAEDAAELGRLLYVGATRARHRLHLIAVAKVHRPRDADAPVWRAPVKGSALERVWPALAERIAPPDAEASIDLEAEAEEVVPEPPQLVRLPAAWTMPALPAALPPAAVRAAARNDAPAFDWAHATAAAVGTVAHRLLAQIARDGVDAWDDARLAREQNRIRADLALAGVAAAERDTAARRVSDAVVRTLADPRGRWLFAAEHADAMSEWSLAGVDGGEIAHVALDRTFVSDGVRWIVDFKTGMHEGADAGVFLDREVERYRPQLERYARIVRGLDARPIRLALYYPLVENGFRAFDFDG